MYFSRYFQMKNSFQKLNQLLKFQFNLWRRFAIFDFPIFNDFLPKQVEEEEYNPSWGVSHLEKVDSFLVDNFLESFDLFDELPSFVSEEEYEVHIQEEEN